MKKKNNLKISNIFPLRENQPKILELDQRSREIFKLIVEDFLKDGLPVGSRKIIY